VQGSFSDWYKNKTSYLDAYAKQAAISNLNELSSARGARLPVCVSNHTQLLDYTETNGDLKHTSGQTFPCNCGNDWGDDAVPFYRTDPSWYGLQSSHGHSHLGDYVRMCRKKLQEPYQHKVAKFAVNMCYVTMRMYPEVQDGLFNNKEPSGPKDGRQVCKGITNTVYRMRHHELKNEAEIDSYVCSAANVNRGNSGEDGYHEGFQRILHEIHKKCH